MATDEEQPFPRGFLVHEQEGRGLLRTPVGERIEVGRGRECGLAIDDSAASRRHLEVVRQADVFHWRDLGSTNGTLLNGRKALEGILQPGDTLRIGETDLRFELGSPDEERKAAPRGGTGPDAQGQGKAEELLRAVCSVMSDVASNYEPCGLVDRILETSMRAIDAQRAAVFFSDDGESLLPCPECGNVHMMEEGRSRHALPGEIPISGTVARRVLSGGECVLFQDTAGDVELNTSESILALELRSIICVPLRGKRGVLGVLYVDSNRKDRKYSEDDMLLSAAVGNSAGLAIENARMHREILAKERMDQEIAHAWAIQKSFLVKSWPDSDSRFTVYGETRPAKVVGGDFYDFVRPREGVVGILVGDVSGKGIPAALTMAQLLAEFRLHAANQTSPSEVLRALNRGFAARSEFGIFCTIHYITLDLASGRALSANGGHYPAFRMCPSGIDEFGEATGPPIGIIDNASWDDYEIMLSPGDGLLLFTDGLVEARAAGVEPAQDDMGEYGLAALRQRVESLCDKAPRAVITAVNDDVLRHCAPDLPHDDCTMIALRYTGGRD